MLKFAHQPHYCKTDVTCRFLSVMITEKELFGQGWKRFGDEENDPYYKVILEPKVFGLYDLSGNFTEDGNFKIYSIHNRVFTEINQIAELFLHCQFEINWDIMGRYGSDIPLNGR